MGGLRGYAPAQEVAELDAGGSLVVKKRNRIG